MRRASSLLVVSFLLLALLIFTSCIDINGKESLRQEKEYNGHFVVSGSPAGLPIIKLLTDAFSEKYPGVTFDYRLGLRASVALKQVESGSIDIAVFARDLKAEEQNQKLYIDKIATDIITVIVNESIPLNSLTTAQIRNIYSGKIRSWSALCGADSPIIICDLNEDESAKVAMRRSVLGNDVSITERAIVLDKETDLMDAVSSTNYSIGYCSVVQAKKQSKIKVLKLDNVEPSASNVNTGKYEVVRTVGLATLNQNEMLKQFINFAHSKEASEILVSNGYMPVDDRK